MAACLGMILMGSLAWSAVPVLDHVFPASVGVGTTNTVTLVGKFDPWPPQIWTDGAGLRWEATTNSGVFTVTVAPEATPGVRLVRAYLPEGTSAPRFLRVTTTAPVAEVEPNGEPGTAQKLPLPRVAVNGRLEKNGDVDAYALDLVEGQTVVAWLEAYQLMSPLDPVLRLIDPKGVPVAWNHDEPRSLDPVLTWKVQSPGIHVLQVFGFAYPADSDLRFSGNARGVYRLQVTTGPVAHHLWPLGVERGTPGEREVRGWNLTPEPRRLTFDAAVSGTNGWTVVTFPGTETSVEVPVGEGRELVEVEPNSKPAEAQSVELPVGISGEASSPGDEDRFRFTAKKGDRLVFEVQAVRLGFGWDAWLAVESADGKELTRVDDATGADPRLEWTAPEDGTYVVAVGNLLQRGSPESFYRLSLTPARPDFRPTVPESAFTLTAGQTNEVKVAVNRLQGFAGKLSVQTVGLPDGVSATPVDVPETAGEAVLRWIATTNAAPTNAVIRIEATDSANSQVRVAVQDLVSAGENNGVPQGYRRLVRESVSDLWLTVLPVPTPKEEKPKEEKK